MQGKVLGDLMFVRIDASYFGLKILWLQLLLVDKKITNAKEMFKVLDNAVKEKYPIVIVAEGIEQEALAPVIRNKLKGTLKAVAIKAPAFGERKSHYLDDIAILTGGSETRSPNLKCVTFFHFNDIFLANLMKKSL